MVGLFCFLLTLFASPFKSKARLEAENAVLRHQLAVLQRKVRGRIQFTNGDRLFLIQLYRWFPSVLKTITIIRPETIVRWHRAGFRRYWRWKSRSFGGRPPIDADVRALIRRMSVDNPLWGAPRIHGELLKLGFEVAQSSVAKLCLLKIPNRSQTCHISFIRPHHKMEQRTGTVLVVVTSTNNYLRYGTACIGCGGLLIAPVRSKYVTTLQVRHVWSCDTCDSKFETSDHLRSSEARRTVRPLPLFVA
jgi:hypothetical protein